MISYIRHHAVKKIQSINTYFFGESVISNHDSLWFYGVGTSMVGTLALSIVAKIVLV